MIKLLREYPQFLKFWIATIASQLASRVHSLILIWLVYKWTNSASMVGLTMIGASLPSILISPFAGSFVDRHNKIILMYIADFIRMAILLGFAYLFYKNLLTIPLLITGTIIISLSSAFFNPASMAVLPQLVEKEDIRKANATGQIASSASSIIGPLFGSALIATLGETNAFVGASFLFFISVISLFGIEDKSLQTQKQTTSLLEDIKSSFSLITKYEIVSKMITKMAIINFFFTSIVIIAPILVKGDATDMSYLMSSIGLGMLCSSILFSSKQFDIQVSTLLSLSLSTMGISFILLGFTELLYLQNFYVFLIGMALNTFNIVLVSLYQTRLPAESLGKIMAFIVAISLSLQPVSYGVMGVVIEKLGVEDVLTISGIVILLSSYSVYRLKKLNKE